MILIGCVIAMEEPRNLGVTEVIRIVRCGTEAVQKTQADIQFPAGPDPQKQKTYPFGITLQDKKAIDQSEIICMKDYCERKENGVRS